MAALCSRRHRFPPEIIHYAIWLYLCFTRSYIETLRNCWPNEGSTSAEVRPPRSRDGCASVALGRAIAHYRPCARRCELSLVTR